MDETALLYHITMLLTIFSLSLSQDVMKYNFNLTLIFNFFLRLDMSRTNILKFILALKCGRQSFSALKKIAYIRAKRSEG